jgi:exonuclease VII small subunit
MKQNLIKADRGAIFSSSYSKPVKKKKAPKNTLEQRVRKLENENKELWEMIEKLEVAIGLKRIGEL